MKKIIFILIALSLAACVKEHRGGAGEGDDAKIRLTIHSAGPLPGTRAVDNVEYSIRNVCALVLEETATEGIYTYAYMTEGKNLGQETEMSAQFDLSVKTSEKYLKFIILANYPADLASTLPAAGTLEDDLRNGVIAMFDGHAESIPMYGETEIAALSATNVNRITVNMVRAMAKVTVTRGLAADSYPFTVKEIHVVRANDRMQIIPDRTAFSEAVEPTIIKPSVPDGTTRLTSHVVEVADTDGTILPLYIPGSRLAASASEELGACCVVIGGLFRGDTNISYYRVDFDSGLADHPFGQVLRNHVYNFNITKVLDRGLPTVDEAANQVAKSMLAVVSAWTETAESIIMPQTGNMVSFSDNDIDLRWKAGSENTIDIESTVPFTWSLQGDVTVATSVDGATQQNTQFSALLENLGTTYLLENGKTVYQYRLHVTALTDNLFTTDLTSRIYVEAGTGGLYLNIRQGTKGDDAGRIITVLSFGTGEASLGNQAGSVAVGSQALRDLLTNPANFGPSGVVPMASFNFIQLPVGATLTQLNAVLPSVDIMMLGQGCNPAADVSAAIAGWLQAGSHVLFMGKDTAATNTILESTLEATPGMPNLTWNANTDLLGALTDILGSVLDIIGTKSYGSFVPDPLLSGLLFTNPFSEGPFGTINRGLAAILAITDGNRVNPNAASSAQFLDSRDLLSLGLLDTDSLLPVVNYSAVNTVTVVVTSVVTEFASDNMMMCVDPNHRIVYMGQSALFQTPCMTAGGSATVSPLNMVVGNVWAWAVGEVMN